MQKERKDIDERLKAAFESNLVQEKLFASRRFEGRSIFDIHQVSIYDQQFIDYLDAKMKRDSDAAKQLLS